MSVANANTSIKAMPAKTVLSGISAASTRRSRASQPVRLRRPALRLLTCGGDFNPQTGQYDANLIVYLHESVPSG